ncbi:hypothetical protein C8Q79DRAFT_365711 [Trametes meyenii]|nr:hypothetical protein C8Q79DRAFT_365711 [Trametes meyenii]
MQSFANTPVSLEYAALKCRLQNHADNLERYVQATADGQPYLDIQLSLYATINMYRILERLKWFENGARNDLMNHTGVDTFRGVRATEAVLQIAETAQAQKLIKILLISVEVAFRKGDYDTAVRASKELMVAGPTHSPGQGMWLGAALLRSRRDEEAVSLCYVYMTHQEPWDDRTVSVVRGRFALPGDFIGKLTGCAERRDMHAHYFYTAALALFRLGEDNREAATECLRVATRLDPLFALRVVGSCGKPRSLWRGPYPAINGPEMCRDYLWLVQDLWNTQDDVRGWIKDDPGVKIALRATCERPGCTKSKATRDRYRVCRSCQVTTYCSKRCGVTDRERHQRSCSPRYARYGLIPESVKHTHLTLPGSTDFLIEGPDYTTLQRTLGV